MLVFDDDVVSAPIKQTALGKSFANAIIEASSISTKKEKHQALSGLGEDSIRLVYECFNPYRVFNVRKYDAGILHRAVRVRALLRPV